MKQVGKTNVQISDFVYGCWQMGGDYWGAADDDKARTLVRYAIDKGITTFDTAYCYGQGRAETTLGDILTGVDRSSYQMISKLWMDSLKYDDTIKACEASLKRLKVDYLDVYFIHYPDRTGTMPISGTMRALEKLRAEGKIRAIGVSNFSLKQMKEAAEYGQIDINQPCYNLLWRYIDKKIRPYCIENNISIIPYSSLAQGLLTGTFTRENRPQSDGRRVSALAQEPYYDRAMNVTDEVVRLAKKYNVSPACVALNWNLHQEGITAPIVGVSEQRDVDELFVAQGLKLTEEDHAELDRVSKAFCDTMPYFLSLFQPTIIPDPDEDA